MSDKSVLKYENTDRIINNKREKVIEYEPEIELKLLSLSRVKYEQRVVKEWSNKTINDSSNSDFSTEKVKSSSLWKVLLKLWKKKV